MFVSVVRTMISECLLENWNPGEKGSLLNVLSNFLTCAILCKLILSQGQLIQPAGLI